MALPSLAAEGSLRGGATLWVGRGVAVEAQGIVPEQTCRCRMRQDGTCYSDAAFDFCQLPQTAHCAPVFSPVTHQWTCACACY